MFCSNCGQALAPEAKFCSNCGAPVNTGASSVSQSESDRERERREDFEKAWGGTSNSAKSFTPPPPPEEKPADPYDESAYEGGFSDRKPTWEIEREKLREEPSDEWAMFDLGPAKPRRRRTWLWVALGLIAFVFLACCVFMWWITATDAGTEWFEGIATQAAEEIQRATEQSATPAP